jgi:hypothetical protein
MPTVSMAGAADGSLIPPACLAPGASEPVFKAQAVNQLAPARRELYSWTTNEQAAALRADRVLFTTVEQEGLGPGYAFTFLSQIASGASDPEQQQLASLLGGELFAKKRYAWSEPWATRMGWPGEDYGGNLLRVVLKPEAWLVIVTGGVLSVSDLDNHPIAISEALLHPERIGAIYYVNDSSGSGPFCNSSFATGSNGYREFILGNLAMVEEWSIGTQEIRDRLVKNIADLTRFFSTTRACPTPQSEAQWNRQVLCSWVNLDALMDETMAYERALAIPSLNYVPEPQRVATIIETLQSDLFEIDPLVVKPGSP